MNWDDQTALNVERAKNPQVGDYWEDHMVGVLQVVTVTHGMVIFFDQKKDVGDSHWEWDMSKPRALTIADFAKHLQYKTPNMGDKTWATVHTNRKI